MLPNIGIRIGGYYFYNALRLTTSLTGHVWCWLKLEISEVKNKALLRMSMAMKVLGFEPSGLTQLADWIESVRSMMKTTQGTRSYPPVSSLVLGLSDQMADSPPLEGREPGAATRFHPYVSNHHSQHVVFRTHSGGRVGS